MGYRATELHHMIREFRQAARAEGELIHIRDTSMYADHSPCCYYSSLLLLAVILKLKDVGHSSGFITASKLIVDDHLKWITTLKSGEAWEPSTEQQQKIPLGTC